MIDVQDILRQGATARAVGRTEIENPFYQPEKMPSTTGEPVDAWASKAEAWNTGWRIEDAMKGNA